MKNILIGFIFMVFSSLLTAQFYNPFPDSNAIWSMRRTKFSVKGDTILSGKTYKKYYVQWDTVNYNFDFAKAKYYAGVREDSFRIYAWHRLDTTERLLYDFNVNTFDTVQTWIFPFDYIPNAPINFSSNKYSVDNVNYYSVGGVLPTKYIELHDDIWGTPTMWFAGIGSTLGLFITGMIDHYDINYLFEKPMLCFQNDTITAHFNTYPIINDSCFSNYSLIEENSSKEELFNVYPNPFSNQLNIKSNLKHDINCNLKMYNIQGQLIFEKELILGGISMINLNEFLPSGLYLIKIISDKINYSIKVQK